MDDAVYNRHAWNRQVERGNRWTVPVDSAAIEAARRGDWRIVLTPTKPVPRDWFPELTGCRTLCLASGGGQQGPILAAAGAKVVVLDNSDAQLNQDRSVALRDGLVIETVQGDMRDLSVFADVSFGLIVHPCSNAFISDVRPVWRECYRVLRPGGVLLAGFINPAYFLFDEDDVAKGDLRVSYRVPYSDVVDLPPEKLAALKEKDEPLLFGHTLEAQIGGQLSAGLQLTHLFEDGEPSNVLAQRLPLFIATRAVRPAA